MTLTEALSQFEALGLDKVRAMNRRNGATGPQFGVKMGDIRKIAKAIKTDHSLAQQLGATVNLDARFVVVLVMQPAALVTRSLTCLVR